MRGIIEIYTQSTLCDGSNPFAFRKFQLRVKRRSKRKPIRNDEAWKKSNENNTKKNFNYNADTADLIESSADECEQTDNRVQRSDWHSWGRPLSSVKTECLFLNLSAFLGSESEVKIRLRKISRSFFMDQFQCLVWRAASVEGLSKECIVAARGS